MSYQKSGQVLDMVGHVIDISMKQLIIVIKNVNISIEKNKTVNIR